MPVGRTLYGGSPYLGVYVRVGDRFAVGPAGMASALVREIERVLGVRVVRTNLRDSEVVGASLALNSRGLVVGDDIAAAEHDALATAGPVTVVRHRLNAMGNNVLANDTGAVVHPEFSNEAVGEIGAALGVPARRGTVAGLGTVGMAAVATNRGVVVHPKATEKERDLLASTLGVPVHRSTANFGVPIVGACLLANTRGIVVGRPTTPVEIVHLQEGLAVLD